MVGVGRYGVVGQEEGVIALVGDGLPDIHRRRRRENAETTPTPYFGCVAYSQFNIQQYSMY